MSGIQSMEASKFNLSAADICRIIKQCTVSGVREFSFQGMSVKFHSHRNEDAVKPGPAAESIDINITPAIREQIELSERSLKLFDEEALREAEEAQLLIDDPLSYEKARIDESIEGIRQDGKA